MPKWLKRLLRIEREPSAEDAATQRRGSGLDIVLEREDGRARIAVRGELDLTTADQFASRLAELEAERPEVLEIDLRGLGFMDSSGLAQVFAANRCAREQGRRVVILKAHGPIDRVLSLAGVEDSIDVVEEPAS
jgi:anti-anti-sigma factor